MQWLDCLDVERQPAQLGEFLAEYGDAEARDAARELLAELEAPGRETWNGQPLTASLQRARSRFLSGRVASVAANESALPVLNPQLRGRRESLPTTVK